MSILDVTPEGYVSAEALNVYVETRRTAVAERLQAALECSTVAKNWLQGFSKEDLFEEGDEHKYLGNSDGGEISKAEAMAALQRAKATTDTVEIVSAIEDFILSFCGFSAMNAKSLVNAVHFQFVVDIDKLMSAPPSAPSADKTPTVSDKAIFDDAEVGMAELLLRAVVETADGNLLADPFSPGKAMGSLHRLPLLAQFVMVLTNAVEATWYQQAIPECDMAINLYASLLVDGAPVQQMVEGVRTVEVMEMTKGAKRGPDVVEWVKQIRDKGLVVLLDDFDSKHPGIDSSPDGFKVCVFANAFHSLQVFKDGGAPTEMAVVDKEITNDMDLKDYYCSLVPKTQPNIKIVVMEGSENCLKSEASPGPPLNFREPRATTASVQVYRAAAMALRAMQPEVKMFHQGGRALYANEVFDDEASAIIRRSGKAMAAARAGDAGTMAWLGQEAVSRANMRVRPLVCGVVQKVDT